MQDFANWVCEGLLDPRVMEDPDAHALRKKGNHYHANVVWLALIGKLGLHEAIEIAEGLRPGNRNQVWARVASETGLSQEHCDTLSEIHLRFSAEAIVERMRAGWTPDATFNVMFS
jgi:hypothetical protein